MSNQRFTTFDERLENVLDGYIIGNYYGAEARCRCIEGAKGHIKADLKGLFESERNALIDELLGGLPEMVDWKSGSPNMPEFSEGHISGYNTCLLQIKTILKEKKR